MTYRDWTPEDKAIADRVYSKIARPNLGRDDQARWIFFNCHAKQWRDREQVVATITHCVRSGIATCPSARY